ncbi:MAG: hypothetical protein GF365_04390 [Candidatus Buchananbacteria bacterium]|nr:hypothetical protein [Candidatus Buchananbacteria bacterium]
MLLATIACLLAFLAVVYFFDPFAGGIWALLFFYLSLFLTLIGSFSVFGLFVRLIFTKEKLVLKKVIISFRQAIWFSLLIIISLHLKSLDLLAWKNIILLILAFTLLELFFMSYKTKPSLKI